MLLGNSVPERCVLQQGRANRCRTRLQLPGGVVQQGCGLLWCNKQRRYYVEQQVPGTDAVVLHNTEKEKGMFVVQHGAITLFCNIQKLFVFSRIFNEGKKGIHI